MGRSGVRTSGRRAGRENRLWYVSCSVHLNSTISKKELTHSSFFAETNGLSGTLPSELKDLVELRFLLLEDGVISGVIPAAIGALTSLEILDLNFNLLGGSLPTEIYGLTALTQIDLNDNLLTGSISTLIGALTNLSFFQVQNNQLTGSIPSEMQALLTLGKCPWTAAGAAFSSSHTQGSVPPCYRSRQLRRK